MPFLWLLPDSKDVRYVIVIAVLGLLLVFAGIKIIHQQDALAAKPKIEVHTVVETKLVEHRVAGPVVIHEKIVTLPSGEKTVDREITRAPVTTDKDADTEKHEDRKETPVGLPSKLWTLTGSFNPRDYKHNPSVGLSRSFGIISIGYSHDVGQSMTLNDGHHINLGIPLF